MEAAVIAVEEPSTFTRIISYPAILGGKPCIKGTRISVEMVLEWVAAGASRDDIVKSYPHLTAEDVDEALNFAVQSLSDETIMTAEISS
jgi:uncharacterized protein (DUF433 family)